jgi:glycosyltransferase involved in cell wall biosynthesis
MAMQNLSICIPTRNRVQFLAWTLYRLRRYFPDAELVVSDNASDETRYYDISIDQLSDLRGRCGSRWLRQPEDIGPFPNHLAALQMGERKYAVYCADDDYLLPDAVRNAILFMDDHPECAAYCAPCEIWNEVDGTPYWNAFACEEATFTKADAIPLFNTIIERHIWPEHIIYRTPLPLKPRTRAYWAFADLPDILEAGAIHLSPTPFYRNLLVHPVGEREQLGNVQCLTYFDEYRAGLEVLAYGLFGEQPYACRHKIQEMISSFICSRMDVASRLYARSGHEADALMLRKRLAIADPRRDAA